MHVAQLISETDIYPFPLLSPKCIIYFVVLVVAWSLLTCNFPLARETYSLAPYWPLVIRNLTRSSECYPAELETVITKPPQFVTTPKITVKNSFGVFFFNYLYFQVIMSYSYGTDQKFQSWFFENKSTAFFWSFSQVRLDWDL